jgi:hypothetical protein
MANFILTTDEVSPHETAELLLLDVWICKGVHAGVHAPPQVMV